MRNAHRALSFLASRASAWAMLVLSLSVTLWAWTIASEKSESDQQARFQRQVSQATIEVENQLHDCAATLLAARGLFSASDYVSMEEWRRFVLAINVVNEGSSLRAVSYIDRVPPGGIEAYLASINEFNPHFRLSQRSPEGEESWVLRMSEPREINAAALGLNLIHRTEIRPVMERARDTNSVTMTPVLQLVQDTQPLPSVVLYLPVYQNDVADNANAASAPLMGWVSAAVHLHTLSRDALQQTFGEDGHVEIIEKNDSGGETIIYDTNATVDHHADDDRDNMQHSEIRFGGRVWTLCFTRPSYAGASSHLLAPLTLISGTLLSLLLFGVIGSLARTGRIATEMARGMTASLRESEARYQTAIAATGQVFYDWNAATDAMTVGGSAEQIFGPQALNISCLDDWVRLIHPGDREAFDREIERVIRTRDRFNLEYRMLRPDGSEVCVHDSGYFIREASGAITRMIGFAIDITDRRRAEEERRQSDERFRVLFEQSGVPFLLLADGRVIDCNNAAVRMLGASDKMSIIGLEPHEFSPEVQPDGQTSRTRGAAAFARPDPDQSRSFEWTCRRANGETFVVEVILTPVPFAGANLSLAGWHDLTSVRRAEEERRRLQRVLQIAVDAMPQRVFWKDTAGQYLGCNRAFAEDAGFRDVSDIVGKNDFDLVWSSHAHAFRADDFEVMAANRPMLNLEERSINAAGEPRWRRTSKIPLCDENGRTIGILGTFEDTTEERAAKDELRRARDAAEAANRAKSDFLANMSHEIRTPMTAILGYADLLADPRHDQGDRDNCIRTIRRNGEHLLTIINDILDLSKIEAGKMSVERIPLSPAGLVNDVVQLMAPRAEAKRIGLECRFDSALPRTINSDPTRVRQMLVNLVGNAVKFTDRGAVRIHTRYEPACENAPAHLRFDVIDSGIGMSDTVLADIFRPFMQADSSMTRRFGGTGLGLTITQRLADLLGGSVSVVSSPGHGSTFTIKLPLQPGEPCELIDAGAATKPVATPDLSAAVATIRGRVLLVEDGPDNQRLFAHFLSAGGAEVEICENGQAAIDRLTSPPADVPRIDLVLMDMQMPVVDGYSATRTIRSRGIHVPIVALTAHAMAGERERCIAAGCNDYATKPVPRRTLLELCSRWMRQTPPLSPARNAA